MLELASPDSPNRNKLPFLYDEILNHPNTPDELRRRTESKQLRHKRDLLFALPLDDPKKRQLAIEVEKLISGVVLLRVEDELAWSAFIDGRDCETLGTAFSPVDCAYPDRPSEGYDFHILRQYQQLFPDQALVRLIQTYLAYVGVPLSDEEEETPTPSASLDDVFTIISVRITPCVSRVYLLTSQNRKPNQPYNHRSLPGE